jgi:hypothetical protein
MAQVETSVISSRLDAKLDPNAALLSPRGKVLKMECRGFSTTGRRRVRFGRLKYRANELADFVSAASQHYGFASDNLVALGTRTAQTSPLLCYCSGQRVLPMQFCSERWCRSIRTNCRIFLL